jgi:protein O-mannosyl-transferase
MMLRQFFRSILQRRQLPWELLILGFVLTTIIYWPGLSGSFFFDDNPNIVDNKGVQPANASLASLVNAALSSPSSEFKRPLASLSFAANYLLTGLDPYWMKLTNLVIHLLNGWLLFLLARVLITFTQKTITPQIRPIQHAGVTAAVIACAWMLLPINLTCVLYVVQRMESLANLFVLLGLLGYIAGRTRMLAAAGDKPHEWYQSDWIGLGICAISIALFTVTGLLAKETAVMLPLYTFMVEWIVFGFSRPRSALQHDNQPKDWRLISLYLIGLLIPLIAGLAWLLPSLLKPENWAARNFTLGTRLLTEPRIVADYIVWTILPTPQALSFYHDNFIVSDELWHPWTTLPSILILAALAASLPMLRRQWPLVSLGIALFLSCHLLTATILPLELVYEHRNYFASFGLLLALIPLLTVPVRTPFALARWALLAGLIPCWFILTALTAHSWGNPISLAEELAARAPLSPRAQYELGRTYIIFSHYDPASPFTRFAYQALEKAASLPGATILPEQALIFMNGRMHLPLKDVWWQSMIAKLKARQPGVQDESSIGALTECMRDGSCDIPKDRMMDAYLAAIGGHRPSARLLSMYADFAWNVMDDHKLGERMASETVKASPDEPAYRITLARMLIASGQPAKAEQQIAALQSLNIGGRLDDSITELKQAMPHTP